MKKLFIPLVALFLCAFTFMSAQTYKVTFKADMRMEVNKGTFNPATDKLTVPGGFNNWLNEPPANTDKVMTDADADRIYEKEYTVAPGTYDYKFNIGLGWDGKDEPGDNSKVTVTNAAVTVQRFFKGKAYTKVATDVTFEIDMTLPAKTGFNPATQKVFVAGNFTDWGGGAVQMLDPDGDKVYTVKVNRTSGDILVYKFIYSSTTASAGTWESPTVGDDIFGGDKNRQYGVVDGVNTVKRFWENKDPNVQIASGAINWTVDMSVVKELNLFSDVNDKVQIRGSFNGWSDSDKPKSSMNQNPLLPDQWFIKINYTNAEVNSAQNFKYYVELKTPGNWRDAYERPLSTGGGDRSIKFEGKANQDLVRHYYDDVYPAFVVPIGQFVQIKFKVDMKDAFDEAKQGPNKMVAGDKLYWISSQPLFTRSMNWLDPENQQKEYFELTDPDGDKIYEGTLAVNGPSFNGFEYRYGFKKADATWVFEPTSLGTTASYRVRYISMTGARKFVQPFNAPQDSWLNQADKSSQKESWPAGLPTSVEGGSSEIPTKFSLEQNYPNPFNPATTIKFNISSDQFVSLKVYNVLGQEVTTLVNEELKAGAYQHDFNASKLSSGVYFYTLKAGDFLSTKKMLFLK